MNVYNIILPAIDEAETARYAGLKNGADFPPQLVKEACLEAKLLASAKAVWQLYPYHSAKSQIQAEPELTLQGRSITGHLKDCHLIAVLAVTVGAAIEAQAAQHFQSGNYTAGLLLEAAGATAVEAAADKVNELIEKQAAKQGCVTTSRFSPGYGDWDITVQPRILSLAGGQQAGIEATSSCMLIPRKSITAVIGIQKPTNGDLSKPGGCIKSNCNHCQKYNCILRRESTK